MIAKTPKPPYYAVIFSTIRTDIDDDYEDTAVRMEELAKQQDGYWLAWRIDYCGQVRVVSQARRDLPGPPRRAAWSGD